MQPIIQSVIDNTVQTPGMHSRLAEVTKNSVDIEKSSAADEM